MDITDFIQKRLNNGKEFEKSLKDAEISDLCISMGLCYQMIKSIENEIANRKDFKVEPKVEPMFYFDSNSPYTETKFTARPAKKSTKRSAINLERDMKYEPKMFTEAPVKPENIPHTPNFNVKFNLPDTAYSTDRNGKIRFRSDNSERYEPYSNLKRQPATEYDFTIDDTDKDYIESLISKFEKLL